MKTKLSLRFLFALILFSLIGQVAWVVENMYFNVFIYNMFNASASDISLMVSASAVAATLTTVFMGALSDKVGKRKIFICGGYVLWGISILSFTLLKADVIGNLFPFVSSVTSLCITLTVILDCIMTFFGSTANDAAFNAWLTDAVPNEKRGAAEGINAMMPLVAILAVFGGFMFFDLSQSSSWTLIFAIIGIIVILIGILGAFLIKDPDITPTKTGYFYNIFYGFRPSTVKKNPSLYLLLAAFAVFNISIQIFMPYLIIYYEKSLKMADYVFIMAPAIIVASAVTALWGRVYDKKGLKFSSLCAIASLSVGYVLLFLLKTTLPVFLGSLFMMCGYLAGMAVFGAAIREHIPENKAGMFQGLRIFSQVLIPGVIGPFIGAKVLKNAELITNSDGTTSFLPNENIFLAALVALLFLLPLLLLVFKRIKPKTERLYTPFEKDLTEIPFSEYPRPNMQRESYLCLNGIWELEILRKSKPCFKGEILVPFPVESRLSRVEREVKKEDVLIYTRRFTLPDGFMKDRLILHFGAVDQICEVYVNGIKAAEHTGGYIPFSMDVTELVKPENEIKVTVRDPLSSELPYGKQRKNRGGMWYTPVSGIWQTVWLESLCDGFISDIKITSSLSSVLLEISGGEERKKVIFEGKETEFVGNSITLTPEKPICWTPDTPVLYEFEILSGEDRVKSYFALRTVEVRGKDILLNGKPYFFHGLLDQGYFPDGIFLPATPEGFKNDILTMKSLGFNTLRKHIKIEPQLFYHYCDKYGMIVFQDMVNSGKYSFLIDTALPTAGLKRGVNHKPSVYRRENFEKTAEETVKLLYNHPCVCYYTVFNEGWGQYGAKELYARFKSLDKSRVWDATSGWFQTDESDVYSEHVYFKPIKLKPDPRPTVLSEFGGYSYKEENHVFNTHNTYGYAFYKTRESFENALCGLYEKEIIPEIGKGLCSCILTQVSDVEDETNGLFTYDRQVLKVSPEKMKGLSEKLYSAFEKAQRK